MISVMLIYMIEKDKSDAIKKLKKEKEAAKTGYTLIKKRLTTFKKGRDVLKPITQKHPDMAKWIKTLENFNKEIGRIEKK
ncbi:hypothetical protein GMMP15_2090013 [Candidatus Magnetomoraceae bacterium gMMP-15]